MSFRLVAQIILVFYFFIMAGTQIIYPEAGLGLPMFILYIILLLGFAGIDKFFSEDKNGNYYATNKPPTKKLVSHTKTRQNYENKIKNEESLSKIKIRNLSSVSIPTSTKIIKPKFTNIPPSKIEERIEALSSLRKKGRLDQDTFDRRLDHLLLELRSRAQVQSR